MMFHRKTIIMNTMLSILNHLTLMIKLWKILMSLEKLKFSNRLPNPKRVHKSQKKIKKTKVMPNRRIHFHLQILYAHARVAMQ